MINNISQNLNNNFPTRSSGYRDSAQLAKRRDDVLCCEKIGKNVNNERLREPAKNVNFCGLSATPTKMEKLFKNKGFQKVLEFANGQPLVFQASFALLLTCIMRPGAIVLFPGEKNKDDQKYAAAHSIASGIIGFAISTVLFYPFGEAVKKIKNKETLMKNFGHLVKNESILRNSKKAGNALSFIDRAPDIIGAIPKGILTVALIPPILKYCFGMEKKKKSNKNEQGIQADKLTKADTSLLNFKSTPENKEGGLK